MTVQAQAISMVPEFAFFDRKQHRKLKKILAVTLVGLVIFIACCVSFAMISMISMGLGLANSMGVFGDGKLSEIIGYASILGSVVGMAGNMAWPGGGIGSGYGADGFGVGYSTETYQATAAAMNTASGTALTAEQQADALKNISWEDQQALGKTYAANTSVIDPKIAEIQKANAAADAAAKQATVTKDVVVPKNSLNNPELMKSLEGNIPQPDVIPSEGIKDQLLWAGPDQPTPGTENLG